MENNVVLFDINKHLQDNRVIEIVEEKKTETNFYRVVKLVKKNLDEKLEGDKLTIEEKNKRQQIEHNAILGDKEAEIIMTGEIQDYLREHNLLGSQYPKVYPTLEKGIFLEIYAFGVFHAWDNQPDSPSAMIIGKEIWFKINGEFILQEVCLRDEEHIYEIFRALKVANKQLNISEANPVAEIDMKDGTRLELIHPPRSYKPTIAFRKYILNDFSFPEQARRKTIADEDVSFFEDLSSLYLNTIIAGHVESGKSTFLKTMYGSRDPKKVSVLIESYPETYLKRDFPNRLVHELYVGKEGDIKGVFRVALKLDHDFLIIQEVRGIEAEGAIMGTERGSSGLLMTYHITDPYKTAEQLAQHIVDEFPNRKLSNEIRRISKQLDLGITLANITIDGINTKKVTSVYEICYDYEQDKAWINYLIKYNKDTNEWLYNTNISEQLKEKLYSKDELRAKRFLDHLETRAYQSPIITDHIQEIKVVG